MQRLFLFALVGCISLFSCNRTNKNKVEDKDSSKNKESSKMIDYSNRIEVINAFVNAYVKKDNKSINSLVHPDLGIAIIFRPGVADRFYKVDSIDFSKPVPEYYEYPTVKNEFSLSFAGLPEFDCGTEKWDKLGFYCDTISNPKQLTDILAFEREFEPKNLPESYIKEISDLENDSYRVILTSENPLIFHVKKHKGLWYVTVLDRAYAGCDA